MNWLCKAMPSAAQGPRGSARKVTPKSSRAIKSPDRDAQFQYINATVSQALSEGQPVISVDTNKKELVGAFENAGQEWRLASEPEQVKVHDFVDAELGRAGPYGVHDIGADQGWVSVGTDHDTATFAVQTIRRWWFAMGKPRLSTCQGVDHHG